MVDGEFNTMVSIIQKNSPNFFMLHYSSQDWIVKSLFMIPKFFITFSMIEKRKPLSKNARRSGWTGCNFLLDKLPNEGKIPLIEKETIIEKEKVNTLWKKMFFLANKKPELRGWTSDVLKIIQEQNNEFKLKDIYGYEHYFKELHPANKNIQAKIRQQLQILRDNNIIIFKGKGVYGMLE